MSQIFRADAARGGPFVVQWRGEQFLMPDPRRLPFEEVMTRLYLQALPDAPSDLTPRWKHGALFAAWSAHYDLPGIAQAQRLAYLVDHYYDDLSFDFRVTLGGLDFGAMWRERRWTEMLRLIDRLPPNTWYSESVSKDPDHVAALVKAISEREDAGDLDASPKKPSWVGWSPEMGILTLIRDEIRHLTYVTGAAAGARGQKPEPSPMPESPYAVALRSADHARRKRKHEALVARLLPHKAKATD